MVSLWGRFSLRNNLAKILLTDNPATLVQLLNNNRIEIKRIDVLSVGDILMVMYGELTIRLLRTKVMKKNKIFSYSFEGKFYKRKSRERYHHFCFHYSICPLEIARENGASSILPPWCGNSIYGALKNVKK